MKTVKELLSFISEDQLLEVMIKYESCRKLEACGMLSYYMFDKWRITKLEAMKLLDQVDIELKEK